jgi:hypothetical protein
MMTDILELFTGIGIVIDDALERKEVKDDLIWKITENIESKDIPLLYYYDLPSDNICKQFKNINFVLLDWELFEKPEPGLRIDTTPFITANIAFIKRIAKLTFVPIFIFSNEQPDAIINHLVVAGIYIEGKKNNIFVKQKSDLIAEDNNNLLFEEIEKWVKETPSIYVLKEWEVSLNSAKRNLFHDFYILHPEWPLALAKAFNIDGADMDYELGGFIYKNLSARAIPVHFDDAIIKKEDFQVAKNDLIKVLEGERFVKSDLPDLPFPGDIFKEEYEEGGVVKERYYINIRAACDIARHPNPELYFLKGRIVDENRINSNEEDSIIFKCGSFIERVDLTYVPFINGKLFEFLFKELKIKKWNSFKQYRIGRLLPPYITKIQQKYSFYIQRQGLPGIPHEAVE